MSLMMMTIADEALEAAEDRQIVDGLHEIERRLGRLIDGTELIDGYSSAIDLLIAGYAIDDVIHKINLNAH
jgi:hypothetical protein